MKPTLTERFWKKPRPAVYERAIAVLTALEEEHGLGALERAYAEVKALKIEALSIEGLSEARTPCVNRLVGTCQHWPEPELSCILPGSDHTTLLTRNRRPVKYVTQPYGIRWDDLVALVERCRKQGLEADIDARWSWHFPGDTIAITVTKGREA